MAETTMHDVHAILDLFASRGIWVWISGGWGVDALVGHQTRAHADLDIGIDADREAAALEILGDHGFEITTDWRPVRLALNQSSGAAVDLHPLQMQSDGSGLQAGLDDMMYEWPIAEITDGWISGRSVRCVSAALQVRYHSGYECRPIDYADMSALSEATGIALPRELTRT